MEEVPADEETTEFVIELGEDDFDSTIESHSLVLAEFYAPWSVHAIQTLSEGCKYRIFFMETSLVHNTMLCRPNTIILTLTLRYAEILFVFD